VRPDEAFGIPLESLAEDNLALGDDLVGPAVVEHLGREQADAAVVDWIVTALRESHVDENAFHDEAIARLQAGYRRLQNRIDSMYLDKLDGRIDTASSTASRPSGAPGRTASCATRRRTRPPTRPTLRKASSCWSWPTARTTCSKGRNRQKNGDS
jgi:hypothetical protein